MMFRRREAGEDGSAVVEFTLVVGLLLVVFAAVIEIAVLLHIRDVVTADAAEGARYEANVGVAQGKGGEKASELIGATLGSTIANGLACSSAQAGGEVAVTCAGSVKMLLFPLAIHLRQTAHALVEQQP